MKGFSRSLNVGILEEEWGLQLLNCPDGFPMTNDASPYFVLPPSIFFSPKHEIFFILFFKGGGGRQSTWFSWDICFQFCKHHECGYFYNPVMKAWLLNLHLVVNYKSFQGSSAHNKVLRLWNWIVLWSLFSQSPPISCCQILFAGRGGGLYFKMLLLAWIYIKCQFPKKKKISQSKINSFGSSIIWAFAWLDRTPHLNAFCRSISEGLWKGCCFSRGCIMKSSFQRHWASTQLYVFSPLNSNVFSSVSFSTTLLI